MCCSISHGHAVSPLVVASLPSKHSFVLLEIRMLRCNVSAGDAVETTKKRQIWLWEGCRCPYESKPFRDRPARAQLKTSAEAALGMGCSGREWP